MRSRVSVPWSVSTLVALGFPIGDPIAGFAVTLLIIEVGFEVTRDVLHHLLDGIEPELIESVLSISATTPGVARIVQARGRWTGRSVRLEITLEPDVGASTLEIEEALLGRLRSEYEAVRELVVRTAPLPRIMA
jgi:divalent metal cation (Fe/Co/Zn/Cd) transporter